MTGPRCGSPSRMAGRGRFWCGAVSKNSPSTPTISVTLPPGKTRWRRLSEWPDNAGKSSNALRLPRANADWITTRFATGKVGTGTSRWPCWPMLCCRCCAPAEKKTPNAQVRLGVPELRHVLTALLWRGWHGIEHLLHWPLAKTSSIPRHDMPLSKAGSNSVFLLSTTVVLSSRIKSTSKSVCRILITPLPAISRGSPKTRTSFLGKPLASRSRTTSSTELGFSNKPTAVLAISASINLVCRTAFVSSLGQCLQHCLVSGCRHRSSFCLRLGVAQILCALPLPNFTAAAASLSVATDVPSGCRLNCSIEPSIESLIPLPKYCAEWLTAGLPAEGQHWRTGGSSCRLHQAKGFSSY